MTLSPSPSRAVLSTFDTDLDGWQAVGVDISYTAIPPDITDISYVVNSGAYAGIATFMNLPVCLTPADLEAGEVDVAIMGAPLDIADKALALRTVLARVLPDCIRTIDVRVPASPVVVRWPERPTTDDESRLPR